MITEDILPCCGFCDHYDYLAKVCKVDDKEREPYDECLDNYKPTKRYKIENYNDGKRVN